MAMPRSTGDRHTTNAGSGHTGRRKPQSSSHLLLLLSTLAVLLACACPARADPSPALDAGLVKEAVRQLQALAVEKEGLDAWSEALAGMYDPLFSSDFRKSPLQ